MARKKNWEKKQKVLLGVGGVLLLALLGYAFRPLDLTSNALRAETLTGELLKAQGIRLSRDLLGETQEERQRGRARWHFVSQRYRVPVDFGWEPFRKSLSEKLKKNRLSLLKSGREKRQESWVYEVEIGRGAFSLYRLILTQSRKPSEAPWKSVAPLSFPKGAGKIAIVLDDWGYNVSHLAALSKIRQPLTISILPGLPYSAEVAKQARALGHEVILHLPMESKDAAEPKERVTITTDMPRAELLARLEEALASVPFARGISNHQGSKATADRALMEMVLREAKKRRLYFLDSLTTSDSVAKEVALRLKLPFAQRAVFLDNERTPEAIRQQLTRLAELAARKGSAVGIGHDRAVTLQFLQEALPVLEKSGYTVVAVSNLLRTE